MTKTTISENKERESWLVKATELLLKEVFPQEHDQKIPEIALSCGFAHNNTKNAIGWCYNKSVSEIERAEIFISPVLTDSILVLGTLSHEIIHAILPDGESHGRLFKKWMKKIGLTGKATSTTVGDELKPKLESIIKRIGEYPHKKLNIHTVTKERKTRIDKWKKVKCPDCGYQAKQSIEESVDLFCPMCYDISGIINLE